MATLLVPHEPVSAARVRHAIFDDLAAHRIERESIDSAELQAILDALPYEHRPAGTPD